MIGIQEIGVYIPKEKESNYDKLEKFNIDETFIQQKIGFTEVTKKAEGESTSDLCVKAFADLTSKIPINVDDIDFLCVCTQNGDYQLPQTSSIVQDKIGASIYCAAFDISLGCSGYVYALHIAKSFMEANQLKKGLLFTADPYSNILSKNDKNTNLLFADAASVTLLSTEALFDLGKAEFLTYGKKYAALIKRPDEPLEMQGREIFNFCMLHVPRLIEKCLQKNNISKSDVDYFVLHQASKFVFDKIIERHFSEVADKVPFKASQYGNTVSSSIPLLLAEFLNDLEVNTLLLSGFGVGLSAAASVLYRRK